MADSHQQFWNEWSSAYQGFSETIEPYRAAQYSLAQAAVVALMENVGRRTLSILDVGGGAGNLIRPLLETLAGPRGHLRGITYTLTDGAKDMTALAQKRLPSLQASFPEVEFCVLHVDTLADDFHDKFEQGLADLVISSWNIEYYPPEKRRQIIQRLIQLAHPHGVVAFSSSVKLPGSLGIRDVLMPLGRAQVLQSLLTGGPAEMKKVIASLKQIAAFGIAVNSHQFPEKPCLDEMKALAEQAGLQAGVVEYHLFGASVMVVARKDNLPIPPLPKAPIAQALSRQAGYEEYSEVVSFWGYLKVLLDHHPALP